MGRPREHDESTRRALLDAAEGLIAEGGVGALSVRSVADAADTTTRAVYSVFGSKSGLLRALAGRAYELLLEGITALPETDDPAADLVEAAVRVFREMAMGHVTLYRIAYQHVVPGLERGAEGASAADKAFARLTARFERLAEAGQLVDRRPADAALQFHALCEGMAAVELRGRRRFGPDPEHAWREAFSSFVAGLRVPPPRGSSEK